MMLTPSLLFEVSNGQRVIPSLAFRVREGLRSGYEPAPSQTITRLAYYPWLIVGTTCIGVFVGQIDASIVQLALPTLERVFDARLGAVSWVAIGYSVAFASILPVFARLAEMFGRKMLYLAGFVFFRAASACDPEHYGAFLLKTVDFIALEFRKRFAESKILITPGNNDQYCQDYSIEANGPFLGDTAERARNLAKEGQQFSASWKSLGSYRVEHPTLHGLRILSLNTIFWSARYRQFSRWLCSGQFHGPGRSAELAEAEQSHEKVWLMFHIPPGIDGWATTHHRDGAVRPRARAIAGHGPGELCRPHPRR
jgi:hypothetical protein